MNGLTYFRKWGFSINEGEGPLNIHCSWDTGSFFLYFFGYWFRFWFSFGKQNTFKIERNATRGFLWYLRSNAEPKLVAGGNYGYEEIEKFLEKLFK